MKLFATALILFLITISSCRRPDQSTKGKAFVKIPIASAIPTLDHANAYNTISATVLGQILEPLYEYHYLKRPYTLQPLVAKEMPIVENNGRRYTIKIKKGIRYHDHEAFKGQPRFVIAQDFINQIKRLAFLPTKSNGLWLFDSKIIGINKFRKTVGSNFKKSKSTPIAGLTAPDDHTLIIELTEPYPQLKYVLAMNFTAPSPLELIEFYKNDLGINPIGSGPFKLKTWVKNSKISLERFKYYRKVLYPGEGDRLANSSGLLKDSGKEIPFLDGVIFSVQKEAQTRWLNFRSKKLDLIDLPKDYYSMAIDPRGGISKELSIDKIVLQTPPKLTYWWISFNMQHPILGKNLNLRKAIAHAINTERYIDVFTNNVGLKANSIYPPGIPGYDPSSELPYQYDLAKAKKYLKLAGYPNGKGLPRLTFDLRSTTTVSRQEGEFIKAQLQKIGIEIDVITNTFGAFLRKAENGKLQFWKDGWAMDYPDAENILQLLISKNHPPGPNTTYYHNKRFNQLFEQLKTLSDGAEKKKLMVEMELIVNHDLPWIMQYYSRNYVLIHHYLKNYRSSDMIYNFVKYLKINSK